MIFFAPAKINIGLFITGKRPDGYHELQSLMYPTGLSDILEINTFPGGDSSMDFSLSGLLLHEKPGNNLCERAYRLMCQEASLPSINLHLHKQIPVGAGLGGGSSDATKTLQALNQLATDSVSQSRLHDLAATLGSDCPYFLHSRPMMMEGRGESLSPINIDLSPFYLVILFPRLHISTAEAYAGVRPAVPAIHLGELLRAHPATWKETIYNDFETGIFGKYPELADIKSQFYRAGAIYASMSGSGSSLYGIFEQRPELPKSIKELVIWQGKMVMDHSNSTMR